MRRALTAIACVLACVVPATATARVDIRSTEGSGAFGAWTVDRFGLPAYDYALDQTTDPRAKRAELGGRRVAWHQLGNDAIVANASVDGHTELWSQARLAQWANRADPANRHYAGGYGYLRLGDKTLSTLWLDRPKDAQTRRRFGLGYAQHRLRTDEVVISDSVTPPFGDDPALVHEVTLRNRTDVARAATWWEYWDVNPYDQTLHHYRGLDAPAYDGVHRTLKVRQSSDVIDAAPLSIFLAAVDAPVAGFEADATAFFGGGTRARPAAVVADRATGSLAPPSLTAIEGHQAFALRSPVTLPPRGSVTLRYVYGIAHDDAIDAIVGRIRDQPSTLRATERAWAEWVPQVDLGAKRRWLSRELQWDAYAVRSSSVYEEVCGHHVITQGGYYQYGLGEQIAYRDPLQHMLPIVYTEPELAREVLRYSFQEQPPALGVIPYGMGPLCLRVDAGASDDLDVWLLLSTIEYVLGTRDVKFLDEQIPFRGGLSDVAVTSGSVWDHVKLAFFHQENVVGRGPNGQYLIGPMGDWSDISPLFMQITESTLVTSQLAYVYPRLAEVAELRGDDAFAAQLRAKGAELLGVLRGEWTGRGWYSRGYRAVRQIGAGAIFGEPQPWAVLAGAPDDAQANTLVGNVRRFLQGRGAPAKLHGPAKIGASISPSTDDPEVTERSFPSANGVGDKNAVYVGGAWYAINGPLTWALGRLDGRVPGAAEDAFDELQRNTLTAHAEAFPDAWDGILNVDDACWSYYSTKPGQCGIGTLISLGGTSGQITHQPAWSLFALLKLAGLEPTRDGYRIAPHLPLARWSIRMPQVGLAQARGGATSGYVRPVGGGPVTFEVVPRGAPAGTRWSVRVNGRAVGATPIDGGVRFTADGVAGRALRWAVSAADGRSR